LILLDLKAFCHAYNVPVPRNTKEGARWYLTTLNLGINGLLRMQFDDLERSRFVQVNLFPRPDRATEGFSFVGHKLLTTVEEHTAWRNMAADRGAMQVQAPIKRLTGALWDPVEQPWGPNSVIDVRDMREIEPMVVPDLTNAVFTHIQMMESTAERIAGVNDIASGQVTDSGSKTLGEVRMATANSEIRMDVIIRRFQEAMEEIWQIRHAILKRVAAEQGDEEVPSRLLQNLEGRGVDVNAFMPDKKMTAALLEGAFRGKPRGSVETADPGLQRTNWVQFLQILPVLMQQFPMPMTDPIRMTRAVWRETLRVFRIENQQPFLGAPSQDLMGQPNPMQMLQQLMGGGMPGMMPGLGPGAPPPPGMSPAPPAPPPSGMGGPPMGMTSGPPMAPGNPQAPPS
jgi:hypothetical protein